MSHYSIVLPLIVAVIAVGIASFAIFFVISTRLREENSAYLAPGLVAACLLGPAAAIIVVDILSIWCFRRMGLVSTADLRNVNMPLFCSLVLALALCGCSTVYFRLKLRGKPPSPISKRSRMPAILTIAVLAAGAIPFLVYHRAQVLILHVLSPNNQYFAGWSPESIAQEIAVRLVLAVFTGMLAAAVIVALLIICLVFCIRGEGILNESNILLMYSGDLAILFGIIAMIPWLMS